MLVVCEILFSYRRRNALAALPCNVSSRNQAWCTKSSARQKWHCLRKAKGVSQPFTSPALGLSNLVTFEPVCSPVANLSHFPHLNLNSANFAIRRCQQFAFSLGHDKYAYTHIMYTLKAVRFIWQVGTWTQQANKSRNIYSICWHYYLLSLLSLLLVYIYIYTVYVYIYIQYDCIQVKCCLFVPCGHKKRCTKAPYPQRKRRATGQGISNIQQILPRTHPNNWIHLTNEGGSFSIFPRGWNMHSFHICYQEPFTSKDLLFCKKPKPRQNPAHFRGISLRHFVNAALWPQSESCPCKPLPFQARSNRIEILAWSSSKAWNKNFVAGAVAACARLSLKKDSRIAS